MRWRPARTIRLAGVTMGITLALWISCVGASSVHAQSPQTSPQPAEGRRPATNDGQPSKEKAKLGLLVNDPRAFPGYTLIAPMNSRKTYLIDLQGRVVRTWESKYGAGQSAYLLENGHLLRAARLDPEEQIFGGMAAGGRVQEFTWDGELIWDFKFHNDRQLHHHDICPMSNGNVLLIVWEIKTPEEIVAAGRNPEKVSGPWLSDSIIEIKPTGKTTGDIVWEWHAWDHLIQDHDATKANYGDVAKHPERIDVNFGDEAAPFAGFGRTARREQRKESPKEKEKAKEELDRLRGLGYVGGAPAGRRNRGMIPDWHHVNAVAYNAELDQIMVSLRLFSELWVIDHSTTTAEAAGHKGGRSGKGGDLLYRWGNPQAYRAGTKADQKLYYQHDAHWIPRGRPGEGHVIVFNNGSGRPERSFSSVDELVLPVDSRGNYQRDPNGPFGPREAVWSYTAPKKEDFFSAIMSGANRLPNGNTLICGSMNGTIFEVTPEKEIVWKYVNPDQDASSFGGPGFGRFGPPGANPAGGAPSLADVLPPMLQFALELKPEQRRQLDDLQKDAVGKLETLLNEGQKKQLRERRRGDSFGFGSLSTAGQLVPLSTQIVLKLTAEQKKQLSAIQKDIDDKLGQILDAGQKQRIKEMQERSARGGGPGFGPGGPMRGPGGPRGFGGPGGGQPVFRAYRYALDYPGLVGKDLTPGKTVEELQPNQPQKTTTR